MNLREMINDYRNRIAQNPDMGPSEGSVILNELSALMGNINDMLPMK